MIAFITILLMLGIGFAAYKVAAPKGYNGWIAATIAVLGGWLAVAVIGGLIGLLILSGGTIFAYAVAPHKKYPCGHCGLRIEHTVKQCPSCHHLVSESEFLAR